MTCREAQPVSRAAITRGTATYARSQGSCCRGIGVRGQVTAAFDPCWFRSLRLPEQAEDSSGSEAAAQTMALCPCAGIAHPYAAVAPRPQAGPPAPFSGGGEAEHGQSSHGRWAFA